MLFLQHTTGVLETYSDGKEKVTVRVYAVGMAADNRDWYRDWWRMKMGYTEKSAFRMSETQRQANERQRAWWRLGAKLVSVVVLVVVVLMLGIRALL